MQLCSTSQQQAQASPPAKSGRVASRPSSFLSPFLSLPHQISPVSCPLDGLQQHEAKCGMNSIVCIAHNGHVAHTKLVVSNNTRQNAGSPPFLALTAASGSPSPPLILQPPPPLTVTAAAPHLLSAGRPAWEIHARPAGAGARPQAEVVRVLDRCRSALLLHLLHCRSAPPLRSWWQQGRAALAHERRRRARPRPQQGRAAPAPPARLPRHSPAHGGTELTRPVWHSDPRRELRREARRSPRTAGLPRPAAPSRAATGSQWRSARHAPPPRAAPHLRLQPAPRFRGCPTRLPHAAISPFSAPPERQRPPPRSPPSGDPS